MSFECMAWASKHSLPALQKIVLIMLANRTHPETGCCIPRISLLAEDCGMSETACKNAIKALEAAGLIVIENRFVEGLQRSNQYHLQLHIQGRRQTPTVRRETPTPGSPDDPLGGRETPTNKQKVIKQKDKQNPLMSGKPDDGPDSPHGLLAFLNDQTGHSYQPVKANLSKIAARLAEGFEAAVVRDVIRQRVKLWKGTAMEKYLRPETLFNATKFAQYAGQLAMILREEKKFDPVQYVNRNRKV